MPPSLKTWLTLCLLLPLAAHATNREQRLPNGFTGYTTNASTTVKRAPLKNVGLSRAPSNAAKRPLIKVASASAAPKQSSKVLDRAKNMLGTPYRWGGTTPGKGFDCSGLVKYAFNDVADVKLPRSSSAMAQGHGTKVARADLKPGDLIFFNIKSRRVNHVAIYLGNDQFIHAPRTGKKVSIDSLDKPYWQKHYVVAKRVLPKEETLSIAKR